MCIRDRYNFIQQFRWDQSPPHLVYFCTCILIGNKLNRQVCWIRHLWHEVQLNHCIRERLGVCTQTRNQTQHGPVECTIDLHEWCLARVVDVHDGDMTQEPANNNTPHPPLWLSMRVNRHLVQQIMDSSDRIWYYWKLYQFYLGCSWWRKALRRITSHVDQWKRVVLPLIIHRKAARIHTSTDETIGSAWSICKQTCVTVVYVQDRLADYTLRQTGCAQTSPTPGQTSGRNRHAPPFDARMRWRVEFLRAAASAAWQYTIQWQHS